MQKLSETEELPNKQAIIHPVLSLRQPPSGPTTMRTINRAFQAYYLENKSSFASKYDSIKNTTTGDWFSMIGTGIPVDARFYKYTFDVMDRNQIVRITAASNKEGLKNYIGIVKAVSVGNNESITEAIVCESIQVTEFIPPKPSNICLAAPPNCPNSYVNLRM